MSHISVDKLLVTPGKVRHGDTKLNPSIWETGKFMKLI